MILAKLEGAWWWILQRLTGRRCWVCNRHLALHAPWHEYRCNRTPLPIELPDVIVTATDPTPSELVARVGVLGVTNN